MFAVFASILFCGVSCSQEERVSLESTQLGPVVVGSPRSGDPVFKFDAPDGFQWVAEHAMWSHDDLRVSIRPAFSLKPDFPALVAEFTAENLRAEKMELTSKELREIEGRPTLLVHAKRLNARYPQEVCVVAFEAESGCAQLTAIYPADISPQWKSQLEESLLHSNYGPL
ncbi:hypothetical protein [Bremerella cremea]|uniref:hypothetical protein n=1 Tax=Bremerella cremea TaxID=1031537 RepID=UPI0011C03098|nr:hypothetical protein [Bremerella cremea]